jgi:hypothetical protein
MLHSIISQIGFLWMSAVCLFAFFKGGFVERAAAAVVSLSWALTLALSFVLSGLFSRQVEEFTFLGVDALTAIALLALALRFAKLWLGGAMLMQSAELALHGAVMAEWGLSFRDYMIWNNLLTTGLLLIIAYATAVFWCRRSRRRSAPPNTIAHA